VFRGEKVRDRVLRVVGVLVLIDRDVAETVLVGRQDRLVLGEQPVCVDEQVVEVHGVGLQEPRLVADEDLGGGFVER